MSIAKLNHELTSEFTFYILNKLSYNLMHHFLCYCYIHTNS